MLTNFLQSIRSAGCVVIIGHLKWSHGIALKWTEPRTLDLFRGGVPSFDFSIFFFGAKVPAAGAGFFFD